MNIQSPFGAESDTAYMNQALRLARQAAKKNEVPIGAIVVNENGIVIARAYNVVESRHTQAAHAEMLALQKAGKQRKDWRLAGCWVYVTLEPCSMCMNMIYLSRCAGVVFGAASPLFGYRLDKKESDQVYRKVILPVVEGVCAEEAAQLLKCFFTKKRME